MLFLEKIFKAKLFDTTKSAGSKKQSTSGYCDASILIGDSNLDFLFNKRQQKNKSLRLAK